MALAAALAGAAPSPAPGVQQMQRRATPSECNGYKELCDRGLDKVAFATTHNSYATGDNIAANQNRNIRQQLDDGIRGFMLDLHKLDSDPMSDPYLCHSSCALLSAGPLVNTLRDFKTFMDKNENEVLAIYIENAQGFSATEMAQPFKDAGLDKYAYAPASSNATWPSLGQMIDVGSRLVVFSDDKADTGAVPWILNEDTYSVQTSWSVADGTSFDCKPLKTVRPLWVMNHFVYTDYNILNMSFERPAPNSAGTVNTRRSIVGQANQCGSAGYFPNFVTVDYYDVGDVFKAVADINGVDYKSTTVDTFAGADDKTSDSARSPLLPCASAAAAAAIILSFI
ncbi:hypothetical protein GGF46_004600 [Coemansia sp. RSA 552]|nr:hypothetical protein GGF46_004600 [Coemansia sp. RSA 552]